MNRDELQQLINNHYTSRVDFVKDILPYTEPNFEGAPSQSNTAKVVSDHLNGRTKPNAFTSAFYRLWFEVKTMNMFIIIPPPEQGKPFFTEWFSLENNYIPGLIAINIISKEITTDGETWQKLEEDHL